MQSASVTAIIPCFRCPETVRRAVQSVVAQTLRPSELILVDDGSDDQGRTVAALECLQQEYGSELDMRILTLPSNCGSGPARNAAWEIAREPILAFLDADDAWHPKKIEIQWQWLRQHKHVDVLGHASTWLRPSCTGGCFPSTWQSRRVSAVTLLLSNRLPMSSVMLKRDLPYRFDCVYSPDHLLWLKLALQGYHVERMNLPLSYVFKAYYGAGGLSRDLWKMERAELSNFRQLVEERMISRLTYTLLLPYSLAKHYRRILICLARRTRLHEA